MSSELWPINHTPTHTYTDISFGKSRVMQEDSKLTMVVSVTEPKLLMKMLQVTFTGGPAGRRRDVNAKQKLEQVTCMDKPGLLLLLSHY